VHGEGLGVFARRALQGAAICTAMPRPNLRFVPVKTENQQARWMVYRALRGFVVARRACINRIRCLLSEFGIVLNAAKTKTDSLSRWAVALEQRRGYWKAVVAIAAKNARLAWAVLTKGESFKQPA
jgi:transposase